VLRVYVDQYAYGASVFNIPTFKQEITLLVQSTAVSQNDSTFYQPTYSSIIASLALSHASATTGEYDFLTFTWSVRLLNSTF
jgi:hypothetical protein